MPRVKNQPLIAKSEHTKEIEELLRRVYTTDAAKKLTLKEVAAIVLEKHGEKYTPTILSRYAKKQNIADQEAPPTTTNARAAQAIIAAKKKVDLYGGLVEIYAYDRERLLKYAERERLALQEDKSAKNIDEARNRYQMARNVYAESFRELKTTAFELGVDKRVPFETIQTVQSNAPFFNTLAAGAVELFREEQAEAASSGKQ